MYTSIVFLSRNRHYSTLLWNQASARADPNCCVSVNDAHMRLLVVNVQLVGQQKHKAAVHFVLCVVMEIYLAENCAWLSDWSTQWTFHLITVSVCTAVQTISRTVLDALLHKTIWEVIIGDVGKGQAILKILNVYKYIHDKLCLALSSTSKFQPFSSVKHNVVKLF